MLNQYKVWKKAIKEIEARINDLENNELNFNQGYVDYFIETLDKQKQRLKKMKLKERMNYKN